MKPKTRPHRTYRQLLDAWEAPGADHEALAREADQAMKENAITVSEAGELQGFRATTPAADLASLVGCSFQEAQRHLGEPTTKNYEVTVAEGDLPTDPQTTEAVRQWLVEGKTP
jgi:hypothetical protein